MLGIESGKRAVEDARHNLQDLDRVRIEHGKVEHGPARAPASPRPTSIVLDPPRAGAGRADRPHLAALGARRIAYVACDPAALARDLGVLPRGGLPAAARCGRSTSSR